MLNVFSQVIFCVFLTRHATKRSVIVTFYRDLLLSYCFLFKVERISNYFLPFPEFLLHEFWQYELFLTFLFLSGNSNWVSKTCKRRHSALNQQKGKRRALSHVFFAIFITSISLKHFSFILVREVTKLIQSF